MPLLMSRVRAPGREGRAAGDGHGASLAQISAGAGWRAGSAGPGPAWGWAGSIRGSPLSSEVSLQLSPLTATEVLSRGPCQGEPVARDWQWQGWQAGLCSSRTRPCPRGAAPPGRCPPGDAWCLGWTSRSAPPAKDWGAPG